MAKGKKNYTNEYVDMLHKEIAAYEEAIRLASECLEAIRTCSAERVIVESAETALNKVAPIMKRLATTEAN